MTPRGRPRAVHLRRGDAPLTWCGRHTQRVLWTYQAVKVTCPHCKVAMRPVDQQIKETGR